ncbi:hypothetical protein B5G28_08410 [Faecalibacterium sp. An77]|uniref:hypothetical protein n=1 Tax=Faecalibacterium sp. An77 TaxID=1965655 RepID=UPI000B39CF2C|nr:hypothetical protein [Faecalibacterium sp. An77]OUN38704.1 hypothetical protein B5G28_08410 [Faecalibacterium sp. An77]
MLKIKKSNILQYILLYMMLVSHGSGIRLMIGSRWPYIFFFISFLIILWHAKAAHSRICAYTGMICALAIVTRMTAGGIGLEIIITIAARILIAYAAVIVNRETCARNYVRLSVFLASASLPFWFIINANRGLLTVLLPYRAAASEAVFFCFNPFYTYNVNGATDVVMRNNGIYTEPTLMCIQLLTTLYVLVAMKPQLKIEEKNWKRSLIIMVVALLTTLSTTGYITFMVIVVAFVATNDGYSRRLKNRICFGIAIILACAIIEYNINGDSGIVGYFFLRKTISVNDLGQATLNFGAAGTGNARLSVIFAALELIPRYPLGCGYQIYSNFILNHSIMGIQSSGGGLMAEMAVFGVIPLCMTIVYLYNGVKRISTSREMMAIYFMIWVITTLSESTMYYSVFFLIALLGYNSPDLSCQSIEEAL